MPPRARVLSLPREVRADLDALLIERGFGGYRELAGWLREHGYAIGRSALQRYGADLERRIEQVRLSTLQAEALVKASPDDSGAVVEASLRVVQQRLFDFMVAAEGGDLRGLTSAARAVAETVRAWSAVREERRRVAAEAAEAGARAARAAGVSGDTVAAIRAAIEGTGGE